MNFFIFNIIVSFYPSCHVDLFSHMGIATNIIKMHSFKLNIIKNRSDDRKSHCEQISDPTTQKVV